VSRRDTYWRRNHIATLFGGCKEPGCAM